MSFKQVLVVIFFLLFSLYDVCEAICNLPVGDAAYCAQCGLCAAGQGDCDSNNECGIGLVCVADVGAEYGFPSYLDVCEAGCGLPEGDAAYCTQCGPCTAGQGDCDSNNECATGLICVDDVGANYGLPSHWDVCETVCNLPVGDPAFCTQCGPCAAGQGDCDGDHECASGLNCVDDVGGKYGFPVVSDVCEACSLPVGDAAYCTQCGPCAAGQGDCDSNNECGSGLTCAADVGANYGFPWNYDVCEAGCGLPVGDAAYCAQCGPCAAGQGDCDSNSECGSGLTCAADVGANYGFPWNYDVCEATTPPPAAGVVITSFYASPVSITEGASTTISWSTENAVSCGTSDGVGSWNSLSIALPNGSEIITIAAEGAYTFTLACLGASDEWTTVNLVILVTSPASIPVPAPLNDTGIDWGGNYPSGNNATCSGETIAAQDCSHGRDATHDDDSDGHAGFSFTKLDAGGNALPASASNWSCVRDEVTGLTWEAKTDDGGLQDTDNNYTWYNPDSNSNGGNSGTQNGGSCSGSNCDTYSYVQAVNARAQALCGVRDWRMPWRDELRSIVDYSRYRPAIDTVYFPLQRSFYVWSGSPRAGYSNEAWFVGFTSGYDDTSFRYHGRRVRLVRGGQ